MLLLRALRRDYLGFVQDLQRQHGDVTCMHLGPELAVDVFDPELVRALLVDHAGQMIRWERGIEVFAQLFGQSVLTTEGATWQRQRRMLAPAFSPKRVAGYAQLMQAAAGPALTAAVPPAQAQALVDMDALFTRVAMDVILRTLFGTQVPGDAHDATQAVKVLSEGAMREMFWPRTLPDWLPLPGKAAKRHAMRTLRGLVARHIKDRHGQSQPPGDAPPDLLAMLLALRDAADRPGPERTRGV
jgi:cytochrome P450